MIWLIGCKGMLGSEVARQLDEKKLPWVGTGRDVDVTDPSAIDGFVRSLETASYFPSDGLSVSDRQLRWIINCSAYTNVDRAEDDAELAARLNADGPRNIARAARKAGARLIHISTDYVFDGKGDRPYLESDEKRPLGVYGKTKSAGEDEVMKEMNQYYIIRTAWLYGFDGKNFVYTMTKLMNSHDSIKVVSDQFGTPTFAGDLASVILRFIERADGARSVIGSRSAPAYGVYHFTDAGETSWYDFACAIYRAGRKHSRITSDCALCPCTTAEYGAEVERPLYSVLSKDKIASELRIKVPAWEASLDKFMRSQRFSPV